MKSISNVEFNKIQLYEYLKDFKEEKRNYCASLIDDDDLKKAKTIFISIMKRKISMPKVGKSTILYWTSRGWDEIESEKRRKKIKRGKEKSPMSIQFWINKGLSEKEAEFKIKSQRKTNIEYWMNRGFSKEESILKVKEFQKSNSNILALKKLNDPEYNNMCKSKNPTTISYWINKGFSEEESVIKRKERQSTFSLKKCIEKYGEIEGTKKWMNRQKKWRESLRSSNYNGKDNKDSKSIVYFKKKYEEKWIEKYILNLSFKEKSGIYYLISFSNYKDLIISLIEQNLKISEISKKIKYPIVSEFYSSSVEDMLKFLKDNYKINAVKSIEYFKKVYGDIWIDKFIESTTYKDKIEIYKLLSFNNFYSMIDYLIDNFDMTNIILKIQNRIISYFYETTYMDMFNYLISKDIYIKSKFGHIRHFNGHICRSNAEFIIAKFLKDNNIMYEYEKKYHGTNKRCDYYLIEKDFYIEYTGMYNNIEYLKKYNIKKEFCEKKNLNHIFSSEVEEIKNKIKEIYEF